MNSDTFVCVTEQHYISIFFTRLWSVRKPILFQYKGRLVTNQQKCHFQAFSSVPASFLLAVWFCIYTHAQLRIPKFQDSVYQKSRGLRTDHKRVKKIETQCCSVTQTSHKSASSGLHEPVNGLFLCIVKSIRNYSNLIRTEKYLFQRCRTNIKRK